MSSVVTRSAGRIVRPINLCPSDRGREITLEEFEHATGREGYQYELIDGRVEVSPKPDLPHDDLTDWWLADLLRDYRRAHPEIVTKVSTAARVYLPDRRPATCPEPDLAVYKEAARLLPLKMRHWKNISPFLVIEVISEDSSEKDTERNVELYLQVPSIREYWILDPVPDPDQPTLTVYRRRGQRWQKPIVVPFGETYETKLLPGFSLVIDPNISN